METQSRVSDTGMSIVYESENGSRLVDIVFIHGLKGHPYKTWTCTKVPKTPAALVSPQLVPSESGRNGNKNPMRFVIPRLGRKPAQKFPSKVDTETTLAGSVESSSNGTAPPLFWPTDLLAKECPESRILMYGYDTKITKYMKKATNKNSVFSHAKDLLFALCRKRTHNRPLIFVAHSLGGIVVKDMLASSSTSAEADVRNVVESTAAIIFLGTPHRGSPELAAFGERVRSVVSALRMDTTPTILDALSLKTTDLERAQETFSGLWQKYDFRVKTFQEGLGLTGIHLSMLGDKVVPNYSSLIGDQREHAETLQANHMEICRFTGADDPNYRKVAGELRSIYHSLVELHAPDGGQRGHKQRRASSITNTVPSARMFENTNLGRLDDTDKAFLRSLWFPNMGTRLQDLEKPAEETCHWLFQHQVYEDWFNSRSRDKYYGLLWLKGKPGAGKSVLMKEAFRSATLQQANMSDHCTAAFFFNSKGDELEKSPVGLFRSLLHQLLPIHPEHPRLVVSRIWYDQIMSWGGDGEKMPWQEGELKSIFEAMFSQQSAKTRRTFIFIDALDECDLLSIRRQAYFWREITKSAYTAGVHLNVCLSSRHFPSITVSACPEIVVEDHNSVDIATYVDQKFKLGIAAAEPRWKLLRKKVLRKSAGVFLWVILVVDTILKDWDDGKGLQYLLTRLDVVPEALEDLFSQMFLSLNPGEKHLTVRLFQWAILTTKPLRLHEWHHILAFIRQPVPSSLQEWRASDYFTENDDQLERQIRSISKGLVEVKPRGSDTDDTGFETLSACAAAGSLDLEHGETRVVQVIHLSVREFFLRSNGFSVLDPSLEIDVYGNGHLSIMATCLDYLKITELDALIQARARAAQSGVKQNWKAAGRVRPRPLHHSSPRLSLSIPIAGRSVDSERRLMPTQGRGSQKEEGSSRMEMLERLFGSAPQIDIPQWMEINQLVADGVLDESPRSSTTHLSVSCRSQVLEDYPALLSYAIFELFSHAWLADKKGTDPSRIISRLQERDVWYRWVTLREDVPQGIKLLDYAMSQGLSTWVDHSFGTGELTDPNEGYASDAEAAATLEDIRDKTTAAVTTTRPVISDEEDKHGSYEVFISQLNKRHSSINSLEKNTGDQDWVPYAEDYDIHRHQESTEFRRKGSVHGSVASFGSASSHSGRLLVL